MIGRISSTDNSKNSTIYNTSTINNSKNNPNFCGGGVWALALQGIQECEKNPMINVAVIDMFSAILPRTIVESTTNYYAGFEAFRRESSGLVVNCLIPSFITLGVAGVLNKFIMPKGTNLSHCWADSSLIEKLSDLYEKSTSEDKVKNVFENILKNTEGIEGKKKVKFADILSKGDITKYSQKLKELANSDMNRKQLHQEVKNIAQEITEKTNVFENVKIVENEKSVKASNITTLLEDSVKFFKEYNKADINMPDFAKKAVKLVKGKSIGGLCIVLPLAASMQFINRWITGKLSGTKGAPIYDDFAKKDSKNLCDATNNSEICNDKEAKKGLLKQKIISISSIIGVSLLSMMKRPSWNMLEFKGIFPTMDQARIISTTTFASRMAAADDKNELAEATVRDIVTFCSLYFLGDYAAKLAATIIQKKTDIQLLNETSQLKKDANGLQKFWHWVKNTNIKSTEEVVSLTKSKLKKQNAKEDKILQEVKRATNLRSTCQLTNFGVSLVILGLIVPIFTRRKTAKKHAEAIKLAETNYSSSSNNTDSKDVKLAS